MRYALWFSLLQLIAFFMGVIHAIFPWWFAVTPYKLSKYIVDESEKQFGLGDKNEGYGNNICNDICWLSSWVCLHLIQARIP